MDIFYIIIGFTIGVIACFTLYITNKKGINENGRIEKIFALVLFCLFFVRYMGGRDKIIDTVGLNVRSPFGVEGQAKTFLSVILLWFGFASITLMTTYPFFRGKIKSLDGTVKYFATPVFLVTVIFMGILTVALDGSVAGEGVYWRGAVYSAETGFALGMCGYYFISDFSFRFSRKNFFVGTLIVVGMLVVSTPSYLFQTLFGEGSAAIKLKDLTVYHRIAVYGAVISPALIYFLFRRFAPEVKRYALLYVSLAAMHSYCYGYTFSTFLNVTSWPLHLCNTAMFIIPLCLIFKWDKLFYFTLFINVLGAFFAMLMPNYSDSVRFLSASSIQFWLNHYCAFFMPVLIIALRIYQRPKLRQFVYSLVAFAVYFLFILVINAWFSNYGSVDFFFINSDFIADKLGQWAKNLRNITLVFTISDLRFTFYPIYQSLFFLVYVGLALAMWFLYEQFFQVADLYYEIGSRKKKIRADRLALEVKLNGRSVDEPMNPDAKNKLILRNFSKKYNTSEVYAVKDANLEIEGGQIFGFLGPNGAGKSTIIKSIVGIQTITSGSIEVCGYDVEKQPIGAKLQTGFVPDHYALYENLTGREYVNYIADLYGVSFEDRTKRIDEYVYNFNLGKAFDNQIKTYSHGMKQKITIMSALVHNPKLWILDEPLTGLDPESIFQVKECMKKHAAEGNIVFFSSHIIDVVERICDRIAIIKGGTILCERKVEDIEKSGEQLEDFYMKTIGETHHD
ncbi:MAG: YwaF family protein [Clostridia bacterium]|nr:YwaF family protein [Clostridia bacterium]